MILSAISDKRKGTEGPASLLYFLPHLMYIGAHFLERVHCVQRFGRFLKKLNPPDWKWMPNAFPGQNYKRGF